MFLKFRGFLILTLAGVFFALAAPASASAWQDDDEAKKEDKEVEVRIKKKSVFDEPRPQITPEPRKSPPGTTKPAHHDDDYDNPHERRKREKPSEDPDPNRDSLFYFPTGKTLPRDELAIGFPGQGIPDIQYGLASWLQIGTGYGLIGFTPSVRLGLIRGKRVDATLVYGAFLPVAAPRPFTGQYAGGSLTAGRDEFHVHLGYYWTQFFGDPFPGPPSSREGGLGYTGMDLQLAKNAKVLMLIATWTEFEKKFATDDPVRIFAVAPGFRYWRGRLSVDVGLAGVFVVGGDVPDAPPVLPMFTLRYRL